MNPPRLLRISAHEVENPTEVSLRDAFLLLEKQLKPPFPLAIPSPTEYAQLNRAITFGVLTEPSLAKTHLTHLHAIVVDGYELFTSILLQLSCESYPKLLQTPRLQLLWVVSKLIEVCAVKVEFLLIMLLRQINGGDFSESNLWLCTELLKILSCNWVWLLRQQLVLTGAVFVCLRLLSDHYRFTGIAKLDELKQMEVQFSIKTLREHFSSCLSIGRDLIRLIQDLVHIPEFKDLWKDLLFDPRKLQVPEFTDIYNLYRVKTPKFYFLMRINPEMESQLRFLLTHVKWGSQQRYQAWFAKKHLNCPESEAKLTDIVRFICCAHHPSNEILQSNVIPRWAVIGWLVSCCRTYYTEANLKLALFYDWLFFDEKFDSIMNIEPAMLLIVNSLPKYVHITHKLLEFLFLLVDNYDIQRKELLARGVSVSLSLLIKKGVVPSLEPLSSCSLVSPLLVQRLNSFLGRSDSGVVKQISGLCARNIVSEIADAKEKDIMQS